MKISLITVSYNSGKTINETFESVRLQSLKDIQLEYIHVDGESSDDTMLISKSYDDIITAQISEPDLGIYNAMNKGLKLATGDVIGFLNSDDYFSSSDVLCEVSEIFKKNHPLDIVYGDINYVDSTGKVRRRWRTGVRRSFASGWHPAHPGFYARRNLFETYGVFDENLFLAADFDLMLRFLENGQSRSVYCPKVFVNMRLGGSTNRSLKNILQGNAEIIRSFEKNSIEPRLGYTFRRWFNKLEQRKAV